MMDKELVRSVLWHLTGRVPSLVGASCCHQKIFSIFDSKVDKFGSKNGTNQVEDL